MAVAVRRPPGAPPGHAPRPPVPLPGAPDPGPWRQAATSPTPAGYQQNVVKQGSPAGYRNPWGSGAQPAVPRTQPAVPRTQTTGAPLGSDPGAMRDAQTQAWLNQQAAIDTTRIGATNQVNPYGSVQHFGTPGQDFTRVESLSPRRQQALDLTDAGRVIGAQQGVGRLTDFGGRRAPFDLAGLGRMGRPLNSGYLPGVDPMSDAAVRRTEDSVYDRGLRLIQPEMDRSRDQLQTRLANQGIAGDSVAALRSGGRMDRQHSMALQDLSDRAVAAGGEEHSRRTQLQMQHRGLEAGLSGQAFGEAEQQRRSNFDIERLARSQELNEALSMLGFGQPQNPAFTQTPTSSVQAPNYLGATQFQQQLGQEKDTQNKGFWSSLLGTLAPLAASFIPGIGPVAGPAVGAALNGNPFTGSSGWLGGP